MHPQRSPANRRQRIDTSRRKHGEKLDSFTDDFLAAVRIQKIVPLRCHILDTMLHDVLSHGHGIGQCHGDRFKLCVCLISHVQQSIFYHLRRDLAILSIFLDGSGCPTHAFLNGSGNSRCRRKNRVQILAAKHTCRHSLSKLHHGVALILRRSAADFKLLVDLLGKSNQFLVRRKGILCIQAHLADRIRSIKI